SRPGTTRHNVERLHHSATVATALWAVPRGHQDPGKLQSAIKLIGALCCTRWKSNESSLRRGVREMTEAQIIEKRSFASPATTPQALAWDSRSQRLWMGSRDLRRIYAIDPENGRVLREQEAPGIPWAAVALNGELSFTIG